MLTAYSFNRISRDKDRLENLRRRFCRCSCEQRSWNTPRHLAFYNEHPPHPVMSTPNFRRTLESTWNQNENLAISNQINLKFIVEKLEQLFAHIQRRNVTNKFDVSGVSKAQGLSTYRENFINSTQYIPIT